MTKSCLCDSAVVSSQIHHFPIYSIQELEARLWMALFQGQVNEDPTRGYPSNVKGWKKKFFFIFGDDWEFARGYPGKKGFQGYGAPQVSSRLLCLFFTLPSVAPRL